MTIGGKPKNSSDLDVGRRPELKSDEFCCFTPMVYEILRCEHFFTAEKVLHLFGALPVGMVVWDGDSRLRAVGGAECVRDAARIVRGGLRPYRHDIVPLTQGARD